MSHCENTDNYKTMPTNNEANEFYNRIVEGTDHVETITLEHKTGAKLEGVELHPVDKQTLAYVVQKLPEDMFEAVEDADSPEEAEEMLEEEGGGDLSLSAMSEDTIEGFEKLLKESLQHDKLTNTQMKQIIESLDFNVLFEVGGKIIDNSFAESGAVKDFHEQG